MAILTAHNKPLPTEDPTETPIPEATQLIVSTDEDCEELLLTHWNEIIVNPGCCNEMANDLVISNYMNLERITIKANASSPMNTLANLNSLTISNNPLLTSIVIEDGYGYDGIYGGCINVASLSLASLNDLT